MCAKLSNSSSIFNMFNPHEKLYSIIWNLCDELESMYKIRKHRIDDMIINRKSDSTGGKYNYSEKEEIVFITELYNFSIIRSETTSEPDSYDKKVVKVGTFKLYSFTYKKLSTDIEAINDVILYIKAKIRRLKIMGIV